MAALDAAVDPRQIIAALRRELEERTAERDDALAQRAATSEILGVISRSTTDIQPVFEAIVARAAVLCEAEFSVVATLDDSMLHLMAVHAMSAAENLFTANPDLTAVYATGEPALLGAVAAVESQGKQQSITAGRTSDRVL